MLRKKSTDKIVQKLYQSVVRRVRYQLRKDIHKSGKIFYSSPRSLCFGPYILMGYNPGGDPENKFECTIRDNINRWAKTRRNHYWKQKWDKTHTGYNTLQKRVQIFFKNLGIKPANLFTSNLWFFRSREASTLNCDHKRQKTCLAVWGEFLSYSPARRIICIGCGTAWQFLKGIGAEDDHWEQVRTCHPRANAELINAKIQGRHYKIAAIPHLSRFSVAADRQLIRAVKRHFH